MRTHHTGDGALVGNRERAVAERVRPLDELFGVRCAAQEREIGEAVQLGVSRKHDMGTVIAAAIQKRDS